MGFLDNSSVTVDAILTKRGREILAAGGDLNITKFALSDEEVDYTLYDVTHPNGTDSYGAVIENMSLLEATPNRTTFRSFLVNQSLAGVSLNVGNTSYSNLDANEPIVISPNTVGGPSEEYIFTIENTNIVIFQGGTGSRKTMTGQTASLKTMSINTAATTTLTVQGKDSGQIVTITISVKADAGSGKDPLSQQEAPQFSGVGPGGAVAGATTTTYSG